MTNFEKIKNEAFLDDLAFMIMCPSNYDENFDEYHPECDGGCVECKLSWLQSEVQDD